MDTFLSWVGSTVANVEQTHGRDRYFDYILVGVLVASWLRSGCCCSRQTSSRELSSGSGRACTARRPGSRGTPPGPR